MGLGSVLEIKSVMFMHPDTVSYVMMLRMTVFVPAPCFYDIKCTAFINHTGVTERSELITGE